jgi:hypothetical protein
MERLGDRVRLAVFLGLFAWICSRRIDQTHEWKPKLLGVSHQPQCLAVALGMRHPEVVLDIFFGCSPFLVAQHDDRTEGGCSNTADKRAIVCKRPISSQLKKGAAEASDNFLRMRALLMPRKLNFFPGRDRSIYRG